MQHAVAVDNRVERQRVVMQQLAEMRHSASSLQERVARLSGDVHPKMLGQVHPVPQQHYTCHGVCHGNVFVLLSSILFVLVKGSNRVQWKCRRRFEVPGRVRNN